MVDLGLLTTDLVLLMADLVLLIGGVLLMVNPGFVCVFFFLPLYFGFVCVLSLFAFWDFTQTVLGFILFYLFIIFYADLYIFLDLWVWFPRGFNIDCVGIFCAEIDFEWVSQLGLSWFGEEYEEWSSKMEVSGFDIFLGLIVLGFGKNM